MSNRRPDRFKVPHNRDLTASGAETEYYANGDRIHRRQAVAQGHFLDAAGNAVKPRDLPRVGISIALADNERWASCGVVLQSATLHHKLHGRVSRADRNRLVLKAFSRALTLLEEPHLAIVICPSEYLVSNFVEGYAHDWRRDDWIRSNGTKVKHPDLWEQVLTGCARHLVRVLYPSKDRPIIPEAEQLAIAHLHAPIPTGVKV